MPCNGNNHSYNCNCGWGGVFHGLGIGDGGTHWQRLESYTTPNARCPACRAAVFFYQSPHGGRVYFDSLGPPWPKHPCTDNSIGSSDRQVAPFGHGGAGYLLNNGDSLRRVDTAKGWWPLPCQSIRTHPDRTEIVVFELFGGDGKKQIYAHVGPGVLYANNPFLIRNISQHEREHRFYELSTLEMRGGAVVDVRIRGYARLDDLLAFLALSQMASTTATNTEVKANPPAVTKPLDTVLASKPAPVLREKITRETSRKKKEEQDRIAREHVARIAAERQARSEEKASKKNAENERYRANVKAMQKASKPSKYGDLRHNLDEPRRDRHVPSTTGLALPPSKAGQALSATRIGEMRKSGVDPVILQQEELKKKIERSARKRRGRK